MVRNGTCPPTSSTTSLLPTTNTSPPSTTSTTPADVHGIDEMRFIPTPGWPTLGAIPPEFVHIEFIQKEVPTLLLEASHIEDWPRRPQRTRTHPHDCGTGNGTILRFNTNYIYISSKLNDLHINTCLCSFQARWDQSRNQWGEENKDDFLYQMAWVEPKMVLSKWYVSLKNTIFNSTMGIS